jgi:hypothetical protein
MIQKSLIMENFGAGFKTDGGISLEIPLTIAIL